MAGVAREMGEAILINPNHFREIAEIGRHLSLQDFRHGGIIEWTSLPPG